VSGVALALASCSKAEPQPVSGLQPSSTPPAAASSIASPSPVASALDGKLVKIENGAVVAAAIQGDPEYFVLYHSASW
jgi:hypothetical protein